VSSIFKDYYERIDKEPGKLTSRMYDTLQPYMSLKPAAPAPATSETSIREETIKEQSAVENIPTPTAGVGDGTAVLIDFKKAETLGIITAIPAKYRRNTGQNYLSTPALAQLIKMFDTAYSQGFKPTPNPGGEPPKGTDVESLMMISDAIRTQQDQVDCWLGKDNRARGCGGAYYPDGSGRYRSPGNPQGMVAYPRGYSEFKKEERPGGPHQAGRAIDVRGKGGGGAKDSSAAGIEAYHQRTATKAQLWIRKNGVNFGWYPYWKENWHFGYLLDQRTTKYANLWKGK